MAAVTVEAARAAREESERLQLETNELRLKVRRDNRASLARREEAAAAAAARSRAWAARPTPSPWSGLRWRHEDAELARSLVPVH